MFRSQISRLLGKSIYNGQCESMFPIILPRFTSELASVTLSSPDEGVPDKLYKKIEIELRGNDKAVLKSYAHFAVTAAGHLNVTVGRNMAPRKPDFQRFTVLKSAHVHKKHRVQYEFRTYFHFLDFLRLTGSTADTYLEYIQRNLPEGVSMKVTKVELQKLPESVKLSSIWNTKS